VIVAKPLPSIETLTLISSKKVKPLLQLLLTLGTHLFFPLRTFHFRLQLKRKHFKLILILFLKQNLRILLMLLVLIPLRQIPRRLIKLLSSSHQLTRLVMIIHRIVLDWNVGYRLVNALVCWGVGFALFLFLLELTLNALLFKTLALLFLFLLGLEFLLLLFFPFGLLNQLETFSLLFGLLLFDLLLLFALFLIFLVLIDKVAHNIKLPIFQEIYRLERHIKILQLHLWCLIHKPQLFNNLPNNLKGFLIMQ
jgi:hypothetical protein